jgi:glycosyltransferase involved in cell wall biosynthesis
MIVLGWPAFRFRDQNPYNWLLYTNLQERGVEVKEFNPRVLLTSKQAIWHLHWPEAFLNTHNVVKAQSKIMALLGMMRWAHARGIKIVWSVHNLAAHEGYHPALENWFWDHFTSALDGFISLSECGVAAAHDRFPKLRQCQSAIIRHGHYRDEYRCELNCQDARRSLGIDLHSRVLLHFGNIRGYKNVLQLMRSFHRYSDPDAVLYVVGKPFSSELAEQIVSEAAPDQRIILNLRRLPPDELAMYIRASDVVVLPYKKILNSGSAIAALSLDTPVLVPAQGALSELRSLVGNNWVRTYDGEITAAGLQKALVWATSSKPGVRAPLESLEWSQLADQTLGFFDQVLNGYNSQAAVGA